MPRVRHKIELPRQTFIHECYTPRRRNHWQSKKEGPGEKRTNHSTSQPYTYNIHHNVANRTRSNAQDQPTRTTVVEASSGPQPHQPARTHRTSFQQLKQFSSPRLADKSSLLVPTPQLKTDTPALLPQPTQVQITTSTRRRPLRNAHRQRLLHGAARCQRRGAHHSDNGVIPQRLSETRVGATTYARSYATVATRIRMRSGCLRTSSQILGLRESPRSHTNIANVLPRTHG